MCRLEGALICPQPKNSWSELSDQDLVSRYRDNGLDAAFAELVRRYQDRLFGVVVGIVNKRGLGEELCQRSFIKAALRIDQLKDPQAFYAWLIAIARTTALDELRNMQRQRDRQQAFAQNLPKEDQTTADPELRHTVCTVLGQMDPNDRLVILLADFQELSTKELSIALQIKESAVKMRVKRSRDRFRKLFRKHS